MKMSKKMIGILFLLVGLLLVLFISQWVYLGGGIEGLTATSKPTDPPKPLTSKPADPPKQLTSKPTDPPKPFIKSATAQGHTKGDATKKTKNPSTHANKRTTPPRGRPLTTNASAPTMSSAAK